MSKRVLVIGSGTGGLATAILLSKKGYDVTVIEKNESFGGRGGVFKVKGFQFDMGPSWYLMPDIFEHFFSLIGENISDHFHLKRLEPSYKIWLEELSKPIVMTSDIDKDSLTFESLEPGVMKNIKIYLHEAKRKYEISKNTFIYKPFNNIFDLIDKSTIFLWSKFSVISSLNKHINLFVKSPIIQKILQYPLLFLGTSPYKAPAVYSLMNHIDFKMGVFYPMGGMTKIFESMYSIAKKNGVKFIFNTPVKKIIVDGKKAVGVIVNNKTISSDIIVSNADYHFTETYLLDRKYRQFSKNFWNSRTLAPSGFILYLGIKKKYKELEHHNLFFSSNWKKSFSQIFYNENLPKNPSYYICAPSRTDISVAPKGCENLFVLVPTATNLKLNDDMIKKYRKKIILHMTKTMNLKGLEKNIIFERIFTGDNFSKYYNAFKGTALGLSQNLMQTAIFRPKTKSSKVKNLYYVGANTNPGIGVPMCLISAQIVYKRINGITHGKPLSNFDTNFTNSNEKV